MSKTFEFPATATDSELTALREAGYYQLDFWRQVPAPLWPTLAKDDKFWMISTIGAARGLHEPESVSLMDDLTADERLALFRLATSGAGMIVHYQNAKTSLPAFTALATTARDVSGLVESCDKTQGVPYLLGAFTPEQVAQAKAAHWAAMATKTGNFYADQAAAQARWFFITQTDITAGEFAALGERSPGEMFTAPYGAEIQAFAGVRARLAGALPVVREWVAKHVDKASALTDAGVDFLILWSAALTGATDDLVAALAKLLEARKDDYRKERNREGLAKRFGQALVSRDDGHAVLAAMRKATKAKALQQVFDMAAEQLTGALGQAGKGVVSWATLKPDEGQRILAAATDPARVIEEALASADANTALRVFQGFVWFTFEAHATEPFGGVWAMARKILATLDRVLDDSTPAELVRDHVNTKTSTDEAFAYAMDSLINTLRNPKRAGGPKSQDEVLAELRAMHAASKNARFRGLLATVLGESHADKLARLATACAGHKAGTVTRWFAERTTEAPGANDINRLYGSPIGVTEATWPRSKTNAPMQHILTLETRVLSDDARTELGDVAAVAVFLANIDEPGGESAVVPLAAADLTAQHAPVVEPAMAGVRLAIRELALPKAVFQGGKKTGPLKELRVALDRLEGVLSTDRSSPSWIQDPEPAGALIAQLDESFAPKLNFGDSGAIYVMTGGVVFQCH